MRFAALLSSKALSDEQRWRLLSSLYDQVRSLIEGSVALVATLAICAWYTGWWGFWALAGVTLVATCVRLMHWRWFGRVRHAGRNGRSPEAWARDYTIGICAMASLWAATVLSIAFRIHDTQLLLFVLLIQNAWLAGAGVRNVASPFAIFWQTLFVFVPTIVATLCSPSLLVRLLAPGYLIFMLILLKVARFYGGQLLSLMESEQRLAVANEQLLKLSTTDGLTGIANRRAFDSRFAADWAIAVREALSIAVVIADVDHFKCYNDHYGHLAGDDCLRAVATRISAAALRASDLPARYGGEEFVLLLLGSADPGATAVAERLREAVYDANLPHEASPIGRVTISVGVASMTPGINDPPATLITMADQALYRAKLLGRNQSCVATACLDVAPPPPLAAQDLESPILSGCDHADRCARILKQHQQ
jgi:diguanylate cyclase (GGDEF)-like protein